MTPSETPPFDPVRTPPARLGGPTLDHPARATPVQEAHELLGIAWAAFDRARAGERNSATLRAPACAERCTSCRLECAVIVCGLRMAHRDYQDALVVAGPVLSFDGAAYFTMAGKA